MILSILLILSAALSATQPDDTPAHPRSPLHSIRLPALGSALALDGIDDFAVVPGCDAMRYPGSGGWTIELWIKPVFGPLRGETSIIGQESVGVPGYDPWSLRAHPTHFEFRVDGVQGNTESVRFDLTLGVWQHVACVYENTDDGREVVVFVNGEMVVRRPTGVRMGTRLDPVYLGALAGICYRGLVDEARVWGRSLGQDAVRNAMAGRVDAQDPDLRAWWSFDDTSAGVAPDKSGHGAHAVLGRPDDPANPARPTVVFRTGAVSP